MKENKTLLTVILVLVLGLGAYFLFKAASDSEEVAPEIPEQEVTLGLNALQDVVWEWEKTVDGDVETVTADSENYTLLFNSDWTLSAQMDCNGGNGGYKATETEGENGGALEIGPIATTLALCPPESRYDDMIGFLNAVDTYMFESDGAVLVLMPSEGGASQYFRMGQEPQDGVEGEGSGGALEGLPTGDSPLNVTYVIDGVRVTLVDGKAEVEAAPGSASMITTTVFGEPVTGDLNGDSVADAGLILVQDGGGSGTFYYAAAALDQEGAYLGTNAILLGDRVAPQTNIIENLIYEVNFGDREEGADMTAETSVGVTNRFEVRNTNQLGKVYDSREE